MGLNKAINKLTKYLDKNSLIDNTNGKIKKIVLYIINLSRCLMICRKSYSNPLSPTAAYTSVSGKVSESASKAGKLVGQASNKLNGFVSELVKTPEIKPIEIQKVEQKSSENIIINDEKQIMLNNLKDIRQKLELLLDSL